MRKPESKVTKICLHCGKSFEVHPYRANTASCCSQSCAASVRTGEHAIHWQGGPVEKVCQCCGKTYKVGKASADKSHYCSRKCAAASKPKGADSRAWQGGPVEKICLHCGNHFLARRGDERRVYCSKQCHNEARMNRVTLICAVCGKQYEEKISRANRYTRSYCSKECRYVFSSGPTSPTWLGGISFAPYPPTFNDQFKRMIRERDNNTCQVCGKRGNHVHHINYVKDDTTPDNCITLCRSCHMKTNGNREYWQEHFSSRKRPCKKLARTSTL